MINRTFRLFISSTFSDLLYEREILNGPVFDALDRYCRDRGYAFQLVDLRWGVNTESVLDQKTVPICLEEVRRCESMAPRPNFLIMVGERYGNWTPVPYEIRPEELTQILGRCSREEKELLATWYRYDENDAGGSYILKKRTDAYEQDAVWTAVQDRLHRILARAARDCGLSGAALVKFCGSATEQEIYEGLLGKEGPCDNTVVYFRNGHPERDADLSNVTELRERIREKLEKTGEMYSLIELDYRDGPAYGQIFEERVRKALQDRIAAEIERLEQKDRELSGQPADFLSALPHAFLCGREKELDKIRDYIESDACAPLVLLGRSGSGKTSLLAEAVRRCDRPVFGSFFGIGDAPYDIRGAVANICREIVAHYGLKTELLITSESILEPLWNVFLDMHGKEPCVIAIDGLDSYGDLDRVARPLFPSELPKNIKLILSTTDPAGALPLLTGEQIELRVDLFDRESGLQTIDRALAQRGRMLAPEPQKALVRAALGERPLPLYAKLLADICASWRSFDVIRALPETTEGAVLARIDAMYTQYGHGRYLTLYAIALALAAPAGIGEDDLVRLLMRIRAVKDEILKEAYYQPDERRIPFVLWSRLFSDLSDLLTMTLSRGYVVIRPVHSIVRTAFAAAFPGILRDAEDLLQDYFRAMDDYVDPHRRTPNTKKCLSILPLLMQRRAWGELAELLSDTDFVDAACKSEMLEELLDAYGACRRVLPEAGQPPALLALERVLIGEREQLSCYRGELLNCLGNIGWEGAPEPTIRYTPRESRGRTISAASVAAWSPDGKTLALGHDREIRICSEEEAKQDLRLYITGQAEYYFRIRDIFWLDGARFVVAVSESEWVFYHYDGKSIKKTGTLEGADSGIGHAHFEQLGLLVYGLGESVSAYDLKCGTRIWSIELRGLEHIGQTPETILISRSWRAEERAPADGALLRSVHTGDCLKKVYPVIGDRWLLVDEELPTDQPRAFLLDPRAGRRGKNRHTYLYPPAYRSMRGCLPGERTAVFYGRDRVFWVDLTDFSMRVGAVPGIRQVVWRQKDRELSVLSDRGLLMDLHREDLERQAGEQVCFTAKKPLEDVRGQLSSLAGLIVKMLESLEPREPTELSTWFSTYGLLTADHTDPEDLKTATLISFAGDGRYAVAYEMNDEIVVFSRAHEPLFVMDTFRWGLLDLLLQMEFSPDSRYLLLRRNSSVIVVGTDKGDIRRQIAVEDRPVLQAGFSGCSRYLCLTLSDKGTYQIPLEGKAQVRLPEKTPKGEDDVFETPYTVDPRAGGYAVHGLFRPAVLDLIDRMEPPSRWMTHERWTFGHERAIRWTSDGELRDADSGERYLSRYTDFDRCLLAVRRSYPSEFAAFLREKNDLSSALVGPEDGRYLILISKLLSSVIVLDTVEMEVKSAYRHPGVILGWRVTEKDGACHIALAGSAPAGEEELVISLPKEERTTRMEQKEGADIARP
ncbi:MAG: DUF4062 domain-containing protein [Oscillospiraceae bacterium]|nr:DUF4062 domain-containing protein [Oscillospiraceae bacterium]